MGICIARKLSSIGFLSKKWMELTVRLLEPGHLDEDYPITLWSFWKQTILKFFLQTDQ